jgi:hypothetical protein
MFQELIRNYLQANLETLAGLIDIPLISTLVMDGYSLKGEPSTLDLSGRAFASTLAVVQPFQVGVKHLANWPICVNYPVDQENASSADGFNSGQIVRDE